LIEAFVNFKTYAEISYLEKVKYQSPLILSIFNEAIDKDQVYAEESSIQKEMFSPMHDESQMFIRDLIIGAPRNHPRPDRSAWVSQPKTLRQEDDYEP
jgi:hypothetical protein